MRYPIWVVLAVAAAALSVAQPKSPAVETLSQPLHFDVDLVQVDAVVTDARGARVAGLQSSDFQVFQDGKRQTITHFLYVPAAHTAALKGTFRQPTREQARRAFVVYVDDRVMSFADFVAVRRALRRFVDEELQPGDLCAFYRTCGGPGAWRHFSSDPRQARAAVDHLTWLPAPPILRDPLRIQQQLSGALRALAVLPGRKSLVLVNSGVAFHPQDRSLQGALFDRTALVLFPMARHLADEANRASVAIYGIDARGLAVLGPMAVDNWPLGPDNVPRSGPEFAELTLGEQIRYNASQTVPEMLAGMTGGLAFHDTNDLYGALHRAADDQHEYYLLGWNPGDGAFDLKGREVKYHSLRIRVRRPGLRVRSRAGYFGVPQGEPSHVSARSRVLFALESPFREEDIPVDLTATAQNSAESGPYIECLLHLSSEGIDFVRDDNGCSVAHLDVALLPQRVDADVDISRVHGQLATLQACGTPAAVDSTLRRGFVFTARQKVPAPGPYLMHVVVRNIEAGEGPVIGPKELVTDSDPNAPKHPVHLGSASQFVNIPDLRGSGPALAGIALGLEGAAPPAMGDGTWRRPVPGDPAIREFHPGDVIAWRAALLKPASSSEGQMRVLYEGAPVYSQPIQLPGDNLHGSYRIDPNAPPGEYLLGIVLTAKKTSTDQWINFQVVR